MKYTVCYILECSRIVEADCPEDAADEVLDSPYFEMIEDVDDYHATVVIDENEKEYYV